MRRRFHFAPARLSEETRAACALICFALLLALLLPVALRSAQDTAKPVGRIEGADVSVDGSVIAVNATDSGYVSNGDVVIVHSGEARFRLEAGGEIALCGPAKFTVLESGGAITLALEFGRMHVEIPAAVSLRIFTPSIVATPLDIRGATRDLTIGLDQNDSLCVIASSGAVRLEQQLSGEHVIIPEAGDFSMRGGQLIPVANAGRSCQCAATPQTLPAPAPRASPPQIAAIAPDLAPAAADPPQPAPAAPVYQIDLPLAFSSSSPAPPATPTAESVLLVREVHADPNWEFTGHVESSELARDLSRSLGVAGQPVQAANTQPASATLQASAAKPKTRRGLWATLKSIF
jgi:hypothetical protein